MRVDQHIVKVFIRQALRSGTEWVTDPEDAVTALESLVAGHYTRSTETDTTLIANSTAGQTFQFQVTPGLSRVQIMAHAEEALEKVELMIEKNEERTTPLDPADVVTALRNTYLRRRSRSRSSFC